jgi:hypothetical protein
LQRFRSYLAARKAPVATTTARPIKKGLLNANVEIAIFVPDRAVIPVRSAALPAGKDVRTETSNPEGSHRGTCKGATAFSARLCEVSRNSARRAAEEVYVL